VRHGGPRHRRERQARRGLRRARRAPLPAVAMGLVLLEGPASPVATLQEAQVQTRSENAQETALLTGLVATATSMAEAYCRRKFVTQRWRQTFDRFPSARYVVHVGLLSRPFSGRVTTARPRDEVGLL